MTKSADARARGRDTTRRPPPPLTSSPVARPSLSRLHPTVKVDVEPKHEAVHGAVLVGDESDVSLHRVVKLISRDAGAVDAQHLVRLASRITPARSLRAHTLFYLFTHTRLGERAQTFWHVACEDSREALINRRAKSTSAAPGCNVTAVPPRFKEGAVEKKKGGKKNASANYTSSMRTCC